MDLPPAALPLLSGLFAALVAVGVTRAIELLGGTLGGLIATLPTTVVPAALGVALSGGCSPWPLSGAAACNSALLLEALFSLPQGMLASCLFLTLWRYAPARLPPALSRAARLAAMIVLTLSAWIAAALAISALGRHILSRYGLPAMCAYGALCFAAQGALGVAACLAPLPAPRAPPGAVPLPLLLARGATAGACIAAAVALSRTDGMASGLATSFPAIFLTVQVGLWVGRGGEQVQGGAVGPMLLGAGAPSAFGMLFAVSAPTLGLLLALALAWPAAVALVSVPAWRFLRWRHALQGGDAGEAAAAAGGGGGASGAGEGDGGPVLAAAASDAAAAAAAEAAAGKDASGGAGTAQAAGGEARGQGEALGLGVALKVVDGSSGGSSSSAAGT
jgi:hypothetical protein